MQRQVTIQYAESELQPAAEELREMLKKMFPAWTFEVGPDAPKSAAPAMVLAKRDLPTLPGRGVVAKTGQAPDDAYVIQSRRGGRARHLEIAGNSKRAVYYGIYDYLRRTFGVFYDFHGDIVPQKIAADHPVLPQTQAIRAVSSQTIRSYKPQMLGDYSDRHSPWAWDAARWEQCVRWCVRQRYNALHLNFFAEANYLRFACAPEAQDVADPYMSTATRIAMMQKVIRRCHDYGLKALVGFCSNGSTFAYANAHPDQKTTANSPYQGYLCWHKGHDHLLAVAKEFSDTYREADGFVLWPHEGGCACAQCRDGRPFLRLVREIGADLKQRYPEKEYHLLDWHFPTKDFLQNYQAELPSGMTIFNVHGEKGLFDALALKLPVIHMACVANWDGSNCTTVSPNLPEMVFRAQAWAGKVAGFEAHHVSMFGGEYTIDAFGDLIWDPPAFHEAVYRQEYFRAVFAAKDRARLDEIYSLLEGPWTAPFHYYAGLPLYDDLTGREIEQGRIGGINYHYERQEGVMRLAGGPADVMTAANMLGMAAAALRRARELADQLVTRTDYVTFLKASAALQSNYAIWVERKFNALLLAKETLEAAKRGEWIQAETLITLARTALEAGGKALDGADRITRRYPEYFHVKPGLSNRGSECQLSDFGIRQRLGRFYRASISPNPRDRNLGKLGYRRMLAQIAHSIRRRETPKSLTAFLDAALSKP